MIEIKEFDLVCVKFQDDFIRTFDHTAYMITFDFARAPWIRMHYAIDLAFHIFGIDYLIPNRFIRREKPFAKVNLNEHKQLALSNGKILSWFNSNLNIHQKKAVANVLKGEFLNPYLIYGPPGDLNSSSIYNSSFAMEFSYFFHRQGTGKTTTLTEIVLQILTNYEHSKIVITTQSNSTANLIAQRLLEYDSVHSENLLRLISYNYERRSNNGLPEDIREYSKTLGDLGNGSNLYYSFQMVKQYRIVIGTSSTLSMLFEARKLRNHFTHAIVDEAGQSTELDVLVPMCLVGSNGQTIMAGDPMQMPPLVLNRHADERGLSISMLSRLLDCYTNIEKSVNMKFSYSLRNVMCPSLSLCLSA